MDAEQERRELALSLLRQAVKEHKRGKAGVAMRLGYGRALIARTLSPNDPLGLSKPLTDRIIDRLHVIKECPATFQEMPYSDCKRISRGPAPTHNPASMHIWKSCQDCPNKPPAKQEVAS